MVGILILLAVKRIFRVQLFIEIVCDTDDILTMFLVWRIGCVSNEAKIHNLSESVVNFR